MKFWARRVVPFLFKWRPLRFKWLVIEMLEWSTKPQFFCLQHSLRTLFTSGTLHARASSSDLLMRPDIDIIAEDSELTASARSISSTAHSRGVLEDRKLLVPTWIIISSGFLRSSGLMWSFMSCVVHPGKVAKGGLRILLSLILKNQWQKNRCSWSRRQSFWLNLRL